MAAICSQPLQSHPTLQRAPAHHKATHHGCHTSEFTQFITELRAASLRLSSLGRDLRGIKQPLDVKERGRAGRRPAPQKALSVLDQLEPAISPASRAFPGRTHRRDDRTRAPRSPAGERGEVQQQAGGKNTALAAALR